MKRLAALVLGSLFVLHLSCFGGRRERFVKVFMPDGRGVTAELAVSEEERARGLMFRETLRSDQGMLFVFEKEGLHSFWMKNTRISLDILWLDNSKKVVHIEAGVPPCWADPCPSYGPRTPARYVLELMAGGAASFGIKLNDRLQFILPQEVSKAAR